jgi:hypothetical protein
MKTVEQIQAEGEARRGEEAEREEAFRLKRLRHIQQSALVGGAIGLASYLLLLLALQERWWFLLLSPGPGAAAAALVAATGGGILRGMIANTSTQCGFLILAMGLGGWRLDGAGTIGATGPLILLFMFIISWPVVGGLLGYLSERFDDEHLVI